MQEREERMAGATSGARVAELALEGLGQGIPSMVGTEAGGHLGMPSSSWFCALKQEAKSSAEAEEEGGMEKGRKAALESGSGRPEEHKASRQAFHCQEGERPLQPHPAAQVQVWHRVWHRQRWQVRELRSRRGATNNGPWNPSWG